MKKLICVVFVFLFLLSSCFPLLPQQQKILTSDETLLKMRELLLDQNNYYGITLSNESWTDDDTFVKVDYDLLEGISDILTYNEPVALSPRSKSDGRESVLIQCRSQKVIRLNLSLSNGGTGLHIQTDEEDGAIDAEYFYDSEDIFNSIYDAVEHRRHDNTAELTGNFKPFKLGKDEKLQGLLEIEDKFAVLAINESDDNPNDNPKNYELYILDGGSLKTVYRESLAIDSDSAIIEKCAYQGYDFRLLLSDGSYVYYNTKTPDGTLERKLPVDLLKLVESSPNFDFTHYVVDDERGIYGATDRTTLLLSISDRLVTIENHEIYDNAMIDVSFSDTTSMFLEPHIMGNYFVVGFVVLDDMDQMISSGFLVYDISTNEKHWASGLRSYENVFPAETNSIMGLYRIDDGNYPQSMVKLNLETLEVTKMDDNPMQQPYNPQYITNVDTNDYKTFIIIKMEPTADGQTKYTVDLSRGDKIDRVYLAVAPELTVLGGVLTDNYYVTPVIEKKGTYLAFFYIGT